MGFFREEVFVGEWSNLSSFFCLVSLFLSRYTFIQYIAHYVNQYDWRTKINDKKWDLIDTNIIFEFFDNDGSSISTAGITISEEEFKSDYVENLFSETLLDNGPIRITSSGCGLVLRITSIILFGYSNSKVDVCPGDLKCVWNTVQMLNFPWFENLNTFTTGNIVEFIIMYNNDITEAEAINEEINESSFPQFITYNAFLNGKDLNSSGVSDIECSFEGRYLFCSITNSNKAAIIDLFYNNEKSAVDLGENVDDVIFSPDNLLVYFYGKSMDCIF